MSWQRRLQKGRQADASSQGTGSAQVGQDTVGTVCSFSGLLLEATDFQLKVNVMFGLLGVVPRLRFHHANRKTVFATTDFCIH